MYPHCIIQNLGHYKHSIDNCGVNEWWSHLERFGKSLLSIEVPWASKAEFLNMKKFSNY